MTTFYLIRHGETEFNSQGRFQGGGVNSPLTVAGKPRITAMGRYLSDKDFDHVIVSPQKRAIQTAQLILQENQHQPIMLELNEQIKEINLGDWDGAKIEEYQDEPEYQNLRHFPHLYDGHQHNGETYAELFERGHQVISELTERCPDGKVLIVSHGVTLITLINGLLKQPTSEIRKHGLLDNASLSVIEGNGGNYQLKLRNFTADVKEEIKI